MCLGFLRRLAMEGYFIGTIGGAGRTVNL